MNDPTWRKPAGIGLILGIILVWTILVVSASVWIAMLPVLMQMLIYLIAGTIWLFPMGPILKWMETGKWRE